MLRKLTIKNFKPFGDTQEARLAPITLIYGPNSSGKSSLIQALMVLKQTLDEHETTSSSDLVTKGRSVDVGNFVSVLHRHDKRRHIEFGLTFDTASTERSALRVPIERGSNFDLLLKVGANTSESGSVSPVLSAISYSFVGPTGPVSYGLNRQMASLLLSPEDQSEDNPLEEGLTERFVLSPETKQKALSAHLLATIQAPEFLRHSYIGARRPLSESIQRTLSVEKIHQLLRHCYAIRRGGVGSRNEYLPAGIEFSRRDEGDIDVVVSAALSDLNRYFSIALRRTFGTMSYLGPLRSYPSRYYLLKGDPGNSVGSAGEFTVPILFQDKASSQGLSNSTPGYSGPLITAVNHWFDSFEIPYVLDVDDIGSHITGDFIVASLKDKRTDVLVGPADVGFGIGQLLPILVDGLIGANSRGGSRVICVEQPEIHLHPRLQAHLADFFIETSIGAQSAILQGERARLRRRLGTQWIIETHSEALMLRVQRRIREGNLSSDDVSVLYVNPSDDHGSDVFELRLDSEGDFLDDWPDGFFDEGFKERFSTR